MNLWHHLHPVLRAIMDGTECPSVKRQREKLLKEREENKNALTIYTPESLMWKKFYSYSI